MSKCPDLSLMKLGKDQSPVCQHLCWSVTETGLGRWGPVLESRQGRPGGTDVGAAGRPAGQQHWPAFVEECYRVRSKTGGLTQGHAQREGSRRVDLEDTGEIPDSSMSICFLGEKRGDGERVDIEEADIVEDYKSD